MRCGWGVPARKGQNTGTANPFHGFLVKSVGSAIARCGERRDGPQETRAISGCGFTASRARGRIRAKPTRKIPYAAKIPNASAAMDAQINIAKFNRPAIQTALIDCLLGFGSLALPRPNRGKPRFASYTGNDAIVAEIDAELTLFSVDQ